MLHRLADDGLIFSIPPQPAAPAFVTAKTPEKARLLVDLRVLNKVWPKPPSFRLPQLSQLLALPHAAKLYFAKLDISNFFWSLHLPPSVNGCFPISAGDSPFGSRQLPFGWSWSPILAQHTLAAIIAPVLAWPPLLCLQYVDEILLACEDPFFVTYATHSHSHCISSLALVLLNLSSCPISYFSR